MIRSSEQAYEQSLNIQYERPVSTSRIYSSIVDFVIFVALFMAFLACSNLIIKSTPFYSAQEKTIEKIKLDSGLYEFDDDKLKIVTEKYTLISDGSLLPVVNRLKGAMDSFIDFAYRVEIDEGIEGFGKQMQDDYNKFRETQCVVNGKNMFKKVAENEYVIATPCSYEDQINICYKRYINSYADPNLLAVPSYFNATRELSNIMIFLEIPLTFVLAYIIVFYVPGLIFRRGRKSLGKLLFKIGIINKEGFNLHFWQYTLRNLIIFLETITFVPAVISFTMMVISKKQNTIHDWLLKTNLVDIKEIKVYFDKMDAFLQQNKPNNTVDFKRR